MNAFFASVEQQLRPELRGRPVAVVPVLTDRTCCIATSYEAKCFGIRTGTQVAHAKKLCPSLCLVEARTERYVRFHKRIIAAVELCLPVDAVHSIDEVSCSLLGTEGHPDRAVEIAMKIKERICRSVGESLRCSIGIAANGFLAKVASKMEKPDGLTVITPQGVPHLLYRLELTDLPGIAARMSQRLQQHGVHTVQQLYEQSEDRLAVIWHGVLGRRWWHWLRGHRLNEPPTTRHTVGCSHVLPPVWRSTEGARAVIVRLIHKAAVRLRRLRYWAGRLTLHVSFLGNMHWKSGRFLGICQDTQTMLEVFAELWRQCPQGRPFHVGVVLDRLTADSSASPPLFPGEKNRIRLGRTMDGINTKYGSNTIYFGGMFGALDTAPARIAFTHIPDLDLPI